MQRFARRELTLGASVAKPFAGWAPVCAGGLGPSARSRPSASA